MIYKKKDYEYTIEELIEFVKEHPDFSSPAFQLYTGDFLSSPRVMLMSPAAIGGFCMLLFISWQSSDCGLPTDDESLKAFSKMGDEWEENKNNLLRMFIAVENRLYNRRLLIERVKQIKRRQICKLAGIKSALTREKKNKCNKGNDLSPGKDERSTHVQHPEKEKEKEKENENIKELEQEIVVLENAAKQKYILLWEAWNEAPATITHRRMTSAAIKHAKACLREYPLEELYDSITNYSKILASTKHYYSYSHTFEDFFRSGIRKEAPFKKFLQECRPYKNFIKEGVEPSSLEREQLKDDMTSIIKAINRANPAENWETMLGKVNQDFGNSWPSWKYIGANLTIKQLMQIKDFLQTFLT